MLTISTVNSKYINDHSKYRIINETIFRKKHAMSELHIYLGQEALASTSYGFIARSPGFGVCLL